MNRKDALVAYVRRDWSALAQLKREHWRLETPAERIAAAEQLRLFTRRTHPGWPAPADRERDQSSHIRLSELLRRAATARAG